MKVYGIQAYAHIPKEKQICSAKLEPRAHIGYLVGYNLSNIYRVWVLSLGTIISTRNVTFDETLHYKPNGPHLDPNLKEHVEEIVDMLSLDHMNMSLPQTTPEWIDNSTNTNATGDQPPPANSTVNGANNSSIPTNPVDLTPSTSNQSSLGITTPDPTPIPTPKPQETANTLHLPEASKSTHRQTHSIGADLSRDNILESRTRSRHAAYLADFTHLEDLPAYAAAFSAGHTNRDTRPHRDNLPLPPRNWKEMQLHPMRTAFNEAAKKEYHDLEQRDTFKLILTPSVQRPIPVTWVFTYKFDENGYLNKCKARLCVRGDLQRNSIHHDNYAATLAPRTFRALMALTAAFNLEAHQYDAVNAFTNSRLDETVHCHCPEGFIRPNHCLLLLRALYGL